MATIDDLRQRGGQVADLSEGDLVFAHEVFFGQFGTATVQWRERVDGLGCAYERMKELAHKEPGSYFLFYSRTRRKIAYINTTIAKRNKRQSCS